MMFLVSLSLFSSYYAIGFFLLSSDGPSVYLLPFKRAKKVEKREQKERKKNATTVGDRRSEAG